MSHTNRNFVIAYILLVGLPLLGLAGILRTGRSLTAPISVDGSWKMEPVANHVSALKCGNFLDLISSNPVSISQSGKGLVIGLNGGNTATGVLEGQTIKASFVRANSSTPADCADLSLSATLESKLDPRTMSGTLSVDGCTSCELNFRAVRQPRTTAGGKH